VGSQKHERCSFRGVTIAGIYLFFSIAPELPHLPWVRPRIARFYPSFARWWRQAPEGDSRSCPDRRRVLGARAFRKQGAPASFPAQ